MTADTTDGARSQRRPGDPAASPAEDAEGAEYCALEPAAREVLDFWFGEPGSVRFGRHWDRWFARVDEFDALIRARFCATLAAARRGDCDGWQRSPLGALALIVVLDQFSRNIFRGTAQAFAGDSRALAAARRMVDAGADRSLPSPQHRAFVYMPFEHDESRDSQERAVRLFDALERETGLRGYVRDARRHAEIIARFGRFPHRNGALGRPSTDEERAFLLTPGSSF